MMKRIGCALLALMLVWCVCAASETEAPALSAQIIDDEEEEASAMAARDDLINRIIALGERLYKKAGGKPQRAHYKRDIYVCKNYIRYLFNQSKADFRMAEYPTTELALPSNLSAAQCKPYAYGYAWLDVPAVQGNPFIVAAQFLYDEGLSEEENMEKALAFMKQVRRGDFFQMTGRYYAGNGAHSAIMIADYDSEQGKVHWMDSNMRGTRRNGIRYGYVQYDAEATIEWWAQTFCLKKRGATIYRLRDDIIYAGNQAAE